MIEGRLKVVDKLNDRKPRVIHKGIGLCNDDLFPGEPVLPVDAAKARLGV